MLTAWANVIISKYNKFMYTLLFKFYHLMAFSYCRRGIFAIRNFCSFCKHTKNFVHENLQLSTIYS